MTKEQYMEKINAKFPHENFEVIQWGKNSYEESIIKCLDCGRIISINTGELFRKRKKSICSICHGALRKDTLHNREQISNFLKNKASNIEFFMKKQSKNGNFGDVVRYKCNVCGAINERWVVNFLREKYNHNICMYCDNQGRQQLIKEELVSEKRKTFEERLEERWKDKFTLLSNYEGMHKKIKVRCNKCGFIRTLKPYTILNNGICPKCDKTSSAGEVRIYNWLNNHEIKYESQKYFSEFNIGQHFFDFYLPDYNLVIEYHGIQHYEDRSFYHDTKEDFKERVKRDKIKKDAALKNGLNYMSIKYTLKDELEKVLDYYISSTTIPQGSRSKCFEIESLPTDNCQVEEDIV